MDASLTIPEAAGILECEILGKGEDSQQIGAAYTSDLLSDVMANARDGDALVTIQAHKNTVAVASLYGASCIIICNSRPVPEDMLAAAREEGIAVLRTPLNQYQVSGRLYRALQGASASR